MAINYDESQALINDTVFRGRVNIATLHFAQYILNELPTAAAHNTRIKWAHSTYQNPDMAAQQVTVMEDQVQAAGAAVSDANLQTAVENAVNKLL